MKLKKSDLQSGDKVILQGYFEKGDSSIYYVLLELGTMHNRHNNIYFTTELSDYDDNLNYHERLYNNYMDVLEVYRNDVLIMKRE